MMKGMFTASRLAGRCSTLLGKSSRPLVTTFQQSRFFADQTVDYGDPWTEAFEDATVGIADMDPSTISFSTSAQRMRDLLKTGLLRHTDLRDNPERFFLAHRILATHSSAVGPGFWVRFTVHYNLCAGTVLALGNPEQVAELDTMQEKGELGCFSLTEKLAGVSSGLVVNTTATFNPEDESFTLHSPNEGAHKNWISQGLVADKTVVVADLRIQNKSFGPHAFLIRLRDKNGEVVQGVSTQDMGIKTVGNDLDNASIAFDNVNVPKSSLLNRFADIDESGNYQQKIEGLPVFHMIGQRLFTGRVAVAQAAMAFRHGLYDRTRAFSDNKKCWSPHGEIRLSNIPHIRALYDQTDREAHILDDFVGECERRLCDCLRNNKLPSMDLVQAMAVAKVKCVEGSIRACHQLQQDIGSYALMAGTGFENIDFLTCCKFAEGDSRILQQKMSRDRMKLFQKGNERPKKGVHPDDWERESAACAWLQEKMGKMIMEEGIDKHAAWDRCYKDVYELSEIIMAGTMRSFMASSY